MTGTTSELCFSIWKQRGYLKLYHRFDLMISTPTVIGVDKPISNLKWKLLNLLLYSEKSISPAETSLCCKGSFMANSILFYIWSKLLYSALNLKLMSLAYNSNNLITYHDGFTFYIFSQKSFNYTKTEASMTEITTTFS